uniref:Uncharacterized protein LOC8274655 n=1 Tax=Rhizophora mucronata TaxID=61149 RepID=A0A2P2L5K3_RHIMU
MKCVATCRFLHKKEPSCSTAGPGEQSKLSGQQFFDNYSGPNHASVPRKLRSAMKKRIRKSISPPFLNPKGPIQAIGAIESPKKQSVKKSKVNAKGVADCSPRHGFCGPITKDEEEVVETLHAMAGMFPNNGPNNESKLDDASSDALPTTMAVANESTSPASHAYATLKEESNSICLRKFGEAANLATDLERSHGEMVKVDSSSARELPHLSSSKAPCEKLGGTGGQVNGHALLAKHGEVRQLHNSTDIDIPPAAHQDLGKLKQPIKLETSVTDSKPDISLGPTALRNQLHQQIKSNESRTKALWPGSSSMVSSDPWSHDSSSQSPATKIPSWLDSALCATMPDSIRQGHSTGKLSQTNSDRRSWKRCATHVHISRFIWISQTQERRKSLELQSNQLKPHVILKQGMLIRDLNGVSRNSPNGAISGSSTVDTTKKNSSEAKSVIFQHQMLHQDQLQSALPSGECTSQKQSFNFLSLSGGCGGLEADKGCNRGGHGVEPSALPQLPYRHSQSQVQHPNLLHFFMSQSPQPSAYPEQLQQLHGRFHLHLDCNVQLIVRELED